MDGILIKITEFFESVKVFFYDNSRNAFLWIGICFIFIIGFQIVYSALHKD